MVQWGFADVGFVELFGTPLVAGRTFTRADGPDAPSVAMVNLTLARHLWPGESPARVLGHRIESLGRVMTVVGVIGNGRYLTLDEAGTPFGDVAFAQHVRTPFLYVRARGAGETAMNAVQRASPVARDLELWRVPQRMGTLVVGGFGVIGLVVALRAE